MGHSYLFSDRKADLRAPVEQQLGEQYNVNGQQKGGARDQLPLTYYLYVSSLIGV